MEAAAPLLVKGEEGRRRGGWAVIRFIGEVKDEGRRLAYVAGPMMLMSLSQYLVQVISSMMVGHLGELALSSTAIATSLTGVTGFSLLVSPLPPPHSLSFFSHFACGIVPAVSSPPFLVTGRVRPVRGSFWD